MYAFVLYAGEISMSLDKSISPGKEHRKPYSGAKAIDAA